MSKLKTPSSRNREFLMYGTPTLKEFKSGWVIQYKYLDASTGELVMCREKFQNIRRKCGNDTMARRQARKRIVELEEMLKRGWTPVGMQTYEADGLLLNLLEIYATIKERELRPDSMRSLRSYNRLFADWLKVERLDHLRVDEFTNALAQRYLDFILLKKKVTNRTYNNYLANMRVMWNWFINERGFEVNNPFARQRKKPVLPKQRKLIPHDVDGVILEYCRKHNPVLELVCHLIYSSYMRVSEIVKCKVCDVHLKDRCIVLPGSITKNGRSRIAYLNDRSVEIMLDNGIDRAPFDSWLIGKERGNDGRLFFGGYRRRLLTNDMDKSWEHLRKALGLPSEYKLYSFRDTGITDLAAMGLPDDTIIKITGHLDKDMVKIYKSPHVDEEVVQLIRNVSQTLGERGHQDEEQILKRLLGLK